MRELRAQRILECVLIQHTAYALYGIPAPSKMSFRARKQIQFNSGGFKCAEIIQINPEGLPVLYIQLANAIAKKYSQTTRYACTPGETGKNRQH